jgi:hypothetical protein
MKREYMKPTMQVVELNSKTCLLQSSLTSVSSNLTGDDAIEYGGGSTQAARVKSNTVDWDNWE